MTIKCDYDHPTVEVPATRTISSRKTNTGWEQLHWDNGRCPICRREYASLITTSTSRTPPPRDRTWPTRHRSAP